MVSTGLGHWTHLWWTPPPGPVGRSIPWAQYLLDIQIELYSIKPYMQLGMAGSMRLIITSSTSSTPGQGLIKLSQRCALKVPYSDFTLWARSRWNTEWQKCPVNPWTRVSHPSTVTKFNTAWLLWSFENWYFQVDKPLYPINHNISSLFAICITHMVESSADWIEISAIDREIQTWWMFFLQVNEFATDQIRDWLAW